MWKGILLIAFILFFQSCNVPENVHSNDELITSNLPDTNGIISYNSSCIHHSQNQNIYPCFDDTLFFDKEYNVILFDTLQLVYSDSMSSMLPLCLFDDYETVDLYKRDLHFNYFHLLLMDGADSLMYFIRLCNGDSYYSESHVGFDY